MRLTRLTLRDFEGYQDADIDWSTVHSVVVAGDNGVGKSALLDAITWALFDRSRLPGGGEGSSPDKLIRDGADAAMVRVEWIANGHTYAVTRERPRGRDGTLTLTVDGTPQTAHTIAETRATVAGLIRQSFASLTAGPLMVQDGLYPGVASGLMKATPSGRKEILLEALADASLYDTLHEAATGHAREAAADLRVAEERLRLASVQAELLPGQQEQLAIAEATLAQQRAEAAQIAADITDRRVQMAALEAATARRGALLREMEEMARAIERKRAEQDTQMARRTTAEANLTPSAHEPVPDPTRWAPERDKAGARIRAIEGAIEQYRTAGMGLAQKQHELQVLEGAVRRYEAAVPLVPCGGQGIYATCPLLARPEGDPNVAAHAVSQITDRLAELQPSDGPTLGEQLRIATARRDAFVQNEREDEVKVALAEARQREDEVRREAARETMYEANRQLFILTGEIERLEDGRAAAIAELDTIEIVDTSLIESELDDLGRRANATAIVISETERRIVPLQRNVGALEHAAADAEQQRGKVSATALRFENYELLAAAFHRDGIPSLIIAEALPALEAAANELLERLPGGLRLTLSMGRQLKSGATSDRLDVVVAHNGAERDYTMLSIGQRVRIDLALRVALSRIMVARTGAAFDTLWLDEPLANLDRDGRTAVMETLAALDGEFGLLVVVSHHEEFNDAFEAQLHVNLVDNISEAHLT